MRSHKSVSCLETGASRDKQQRVCLSGLSVSEATPPPTPRHQEPSGVTLASRGEISEARHFSLLCGVLAVFLGKFGAAGGFTM